MNSKPIEVLLVEDNPGDVVLIKEALTGAKLLANIHHVEDGEAAMFYLRQQGPYTEAVRPDMILLDLNLPRKDGRQVLHEIRHDVTLSAIPVVILSSSEADTDIAKSYHLGANCYVTKPVGFDDFIDIVGAIGDFWFEVVRLPSSELSKYYQSRWVQSANHAPEDITRPLNLLVIEDNPGDVDLLREYLASAQTNAFIVHEAPNLKMGLEFLCQHKVDVVALDLNLSDSTGLATLETLLQHYDSLPVVVLSGLRNDSLAKAAMRRGAQDYLVKGDYSPTLLARVFNYAIERKALSLDMQSVLAREHIARMDAEKAVSMRDEFISVASHELRTPLTTLSMRTQQLLNDKNILSETNASSEAVSRALHISQRQIDRLTKLVDNLLDITQISAGQLRLEREEFDLAELVRSLVDRYALQFETAQCRVTTHAATAVVGFWDRYRIEQVIINLFTNAIKYAAGKDVQISVSQQGHIATLEVKDTGMGIKQEDQSRIFKRFERAASPALISGIGLGLYIVRQIIDVHQGNINVVSEYGHGATFTVTLPTRIPSLNPKVI